MSGCCFGRIAVIDIDCSDFIKHLHHKKNSAGNE
jgi:hypothetical protein